mmetsp:Transcript_19617/g.30235  ORF Transcript_19617/g.30235 Transcript_19617/m.30235 type:complete len:776 (+) Transcript_19617:177-2504(+)|eukprot:CAMPEP_0195281358 /NCGR_PEP_ID=MMETSP0707-20130614/702_1 /TAXON_ID=33640 /ORGANISM="Asterionellopsis glacialis, Strain CCMP134" /LENGTH=775 /DNA_ID=CAMNT_0040340239 /DNA_START=75 /DNA_END=2402 /DNA_ORIENTATION=-
MGLKKKGKPKRTKTEDDVDDRFAAASSRPQFQKKKEEKTKVVLDARFSSVLTDSRFRVDAKDKYGRRKKKKTDAKAELENFYTVEKEEEEKGDETEEKANLDEESSCTDDDTEKSDHDDDDEEEEAQDPASRIAYLTALSRGELSVSSSSDEDDSSVSSAEEAESDGDDGSDAPGILDSSSKKEIPITDEPSPFLAVMNMDWKNVRSVDLFAILASFTPPGSVRCVQIFPSDFGMERMAKEEKHGPLDLWKNQEGSAEDHLDSDSDKEVASYDSGKSESLGNAKKDFNPNAIDSDFDPEKLREYEASKLKYFFAVVEFSSPEHADIAYREVDGLELEHSSAAIDLRSIAPDELDGVKEGRKIRDEARAVPSNYEPPEFVINALQQSNVQCTWDEGDKERELKLTGYGGGQKEIWNSMAEGDDLKAYLASDVSSDEDEGDDEVSTSGGKGAQMRKMLGLDSDSDDGDDGDAVDSEASEDSSEEDEDQKEDNFNKEATFVPGKRSLQQKIRSKIQESTEEQKELTPWEKYQQKRKEKRRERRQAARSKRKGVGVHQDGNDMYGADPEFGVPDSDSEDGFDKDGRDGFFLEDKGDSVGSRKGQEQSKGKAGKNRKEGKTTAELPQRTKSSKAELELLLAGDKEEEDAKDYDMRGILRLHKNKDKKLRGARKRKEEKLAASTSGTDFKLDTADSRFAAVLDGTDDRFGIDRTDPNFKETSAMREILSQQTKRRKAKKRARVTETVAPDVSAENGAGGGGALALSSLVKNLKAKVAKSGQ